MAVVVAVADGDHSGHGHGHDDDDDVYDHHSALQPGGASILERRLFLPPSATSLRLSRDYDLAYPALVKATILLLAASVLCLPSAGCKSSDEKAQDADVGETSAAPDVAQTDAAVDEIATIADVAPSPADKPALTDASWLDTASDGSDQDNASCTGWTALKRLSPAEVSALIATSNPIVINVHIPYAGDIPGTDTSIPYSNVDAIDSYLNGDLCADVVLICLGGGMSKSAGDELVKRGYLRVRDLNGGMQAWQSAGYPLLKDGGL